MTAAGDRPRRSARPVWLGEDRRRFDHIRIHVQVVYDRRLGAFEQAVYNGLVAHAEVTTGLSGPSNETLADYAQCSVRRVVYAIRVLEETHYIQTIRVAGKASRYQLLPPPPLQDVQGSVIHTPAPGAEHPCTDPCTDPPQTPAPGARELELELELTTTEAQRRTVEVSSRPPPNDGLARLMPSRAEWVEDENGFVHRASARSP